ncbi:PEGA domain-containing protein [Candidatus Microgenomates bacterium]|nr:PEGA domain-containing protein [Candidatus Microgenomates bacterium]
MNKTFLAVAAALIFIFVGVFIAIALARGYTVDITNKSVTSTGILVVTSDPDGAEVLIDGKLITATNNTINLKPGTYNVKIQKEGYAPWEKKIEIKKEEVFKTNAFLFPALADLRPITYTGAINPTSSPDKTKIVYGIASASARLDGVSNNGIWILDMGKNLPVSILTGGDSRQIYRYKDLATSKFTWSADEKQILVDNLYLMDTDRVNETPQKVSSPSGLIESWDEQNAIREATQLAKMPIKIPAKLNFSPDGTKVLYTATT